MSSPDEVARRMVYIENLFMKVQNFMRSNPATKDLVDFLDSESNEYRSVTYEAAAMEMAAKELQDGGISEWNAFYKQHGTLHAFHIGIGLGWAFAYAERDPAPYLASLDPHIRWMVFDGFGYYYGLYKARRTIKLHEVPSAVKGDHLKSFDQGLGRRIWYNSRGNPEKHAAVIQTFPQHRRAHLWRGTGVGIGYIGGSDRRKLEQVLAVSPGFRDDLANGIALALIGRRAGKSITNDIQLASEVVCGKNLDEMCKKETEVIKEVIAYE